MKTNGYKLQQRIKELKRDTEMYATQFENGKLRFDGELKPTSLEAFEKFQEAEKELARLQTYQTIYNLRVRVKVNGTEMTLTEAIKKVGGAGRAEAMWRAIVAPKKDRYGLAESAKRDTDAVYATPTYTVSQAQLNAAATSNYASALRYAIQEANAQEIDIPVTDL